MPEEPIIQQIEIQGAQEAAETLRRIGEAGARAFSQLEDAASRTNLDRRLDFGRAQQSIQSLGRMVTDLGSQLQRMGVDVQRGSNQVQEIGERASATIIPFRRMGAAAQDAGQQAAESFEQANVALRRTDQTVQQVDQSTNALAIRIGVISGAVSALTTQLISLGSSALSALANFRRPAVDAAKEIGAAADKLGVTTENYLRLKAAADAAGVGMDRFTEGTRPLRDLFDKVNEALSSTTREIKTVSGITQIVSGGRTEVKGLSTELQGLATVLAGLGLQVPRTADGLTTMFGDIAAKLAILDESARNRVMARLSEALGKGAQNVIPVIEQMTKGHLEYNKIVGESAPLAENAADAFKQLVEEGDRLIRVTKAVGTAPMIDKLRQAQGVTVSLGNSFESLRIRVSALFAGIATGPSGNINLSWIDNVIKATTALIFRFEKVKDAEKEAFLQRLGNSPAEFALKALVTASNVLLEVWKALVGAGKSLMATFDSIAQAVGAKLGGAQVAGFFIAATIAVTAFGAALKLLGAAFSPVTGFFSLLVAFGPLLIALGAAAFLFWDQIKEGAGTAFEAVQRQMKGFRTAFQKLLKGDYKGAWNDFKAAGVAAVNEIWEALSKAPTILGEFIRAIAKAFEGLKTEEGAQALSQLKELIIGLIKDIPVLVIQVTAFLLLLRRLGLLKPGAVVAFFSETVRNLSVAFGFLFVALNSALTILEKFGVPASAVARFFARLVPLIALAMAVVEPFMQLIVDLTRAIRQMATGDVLGGFQSAWMAVGRFVAGVIGNLILQINNLIEVVGSLGEMALGAAFRLMGIDVKAAAAAFVDLNNAIAQLTGFDLFRQISDAGKAWKQFVADIKNLGFAQAVVDEFKKLEIKMPEGTLLGEFSRAWRQFVEDVKKGGLAQAIISEFFKLRIEIPEDSLLGILIKGFNSDAFQASLNKAKEAISNFVAELRKDPLIVTDWIPGVGPALRALESLVTKMNEYLEKRRQLSEQKDPSVLDVPGAQQMRLLDPNKAKQEGEKAAEAAREGFADRINRSIPVGSENIIDVRPFALASEEVQNLAGVLTQAHTILEDLGLGDAAARVRDEINSIGAGILEAKNSGVAFGEAMRAAEARLVALRDAVVTITSIATGPGGAEAGLSPTELLNSLTPVQSTLNTVTAAINQVAIDIAGAIASSFQLLDQAMQTAEASVLASIDRMVQAITSAQQKLSQLSQGGQPGAPAPGFSSGGHFRGRPGKDTNLAWLTDNEYVVRVAAVKKYGVAMLNAINAGRFALGGHVKDGLPAYQGGGPAQGEGSFHASGHPEFVRLFLGAMNDVSNTVGRMAVSVFNLGTRLGREMAKAELQQGFSGNFFKGGLVGEGRKPLGLFSALHGFDAGGFVSGLAGEIMSVQAPRMATGGLPRPGSQQATRPLTLVLEGQRFPNLSGPEESVNALEKYAIRKRHASIGASPSWVTA